MSALLLAAILTIVAAPPVWAAGPWKGQVVDADTAKPLPDVIVFAVWWKRFPTPALIHEGRAFHRAVEVVTDTEGTFKIPAVSTFTLNPLARIEGPDLTVFRAGYGRWRFRDQPASMYELTDAWLDDVWKRFVREGVVIELPPLTDVDERLLANELMSPPYGQIPGSEGVRLRQALRADWDELARRKSGRR